MALKPETPLVAESVATLAACGVGLVVGHLRVATDAGLAERLRALLVRRMTERALLVFGDLVEPWERRGRVAGLAGRRLRLRVQGRAVAGRALLVPAVNQLGVYLGLVASDAERVRPHLDRHAMGRVALDARDLERVRIVFVAVGLVAGLASAERARLHVVRLVARETLRGAGAHRVVDVHVRVTTRA